MDKMQIKIGSRGSDLALWQAHHVKDRLTKAGAEVSITIFKTQGDKIQHLSLDKLEGKGFFTKELEDALLNHEIDLAVHSHKDLPTLSPPGLIISAVSEREDPSELLLIRKESVDTNLYLSFKKNAVFGTSSARRKVQMLEFRDDIILKDIRGNVPTRIQKLRDGQFDAILLARAGVERLQLDLSDLHVIVLDPHTFIPAPAQGVLALQIREDDATLDNFLKQTIHQEQVFNSIGIERKILNLFEGGCHMPLGAYVEHKDNTYKLWAAKSEHDAQLPQRLYLESNNYEGLAEKAVDLFNSTILRNHKIFISQDDKNESLLKKQLEVEAAELLCLSGIETKELKFEYNDLNTIDIIFFNSKNAVKHFFNQVNVADLNVQFAAFGQATATEILKYTSEVHFIGNSSDPDVVANEFNSQFKISQRILFPCSTKSLKSVSTALKNNHQVSEIVVYDTIIKSDMILPDADIFVFTSPSNVQAFEDSIKKLNNKLIVSIGKSTAQTLSSIDASCHAIAATADDLGIFHAIYLAKSNQI